MLNNCLQWFKAVMLTRTGHARARIKTRINITGLKFNFEPVMLILVLILALACPVLVNITALNHCRRLFITTLIPRLHQCPA